MMRAERDKKVSSGLSSQSMEAAVRMVVDDGKIDLFFAAFDYNIFFP